MFKLPMENNKHPNFERRARGGGRGRGRGERRAVWILLFPEVTPFEYNVSTILSSVVDLSTTEKSWQSKPGNSLMEPLRPFPSQSYTLVNLMEKQEGQKVPVEVVNSIISESLDRKCTNSLTYYKQKKTKRCFTGNDLSWCHNKGNFNTWLDLC